MLQIVQAQTEMQLQHVKMLFAELVEYYRTGIDAEVPDLNDVPGLAGYAGELELLPGIYALPEGQLLLALYNADAAGCVALKRFGDGVCELKRLWVRPQFRGLGIGKGLVNTAIDGARRAGYRTIILETEITLKTAHTIYETAGFERTAPYFDGPENIMQRTVFMKLQL